MKGKTVAKAQLTHKKINNLWEHGKNIFSLAYQPKLLQVYIDSYEVKRG